MFTDNSRTLCSFLFPTELTAIDHGLDDRADATQLTTTCDECGQTMIDVDHDTVCPNCATVVESGPDDVSDPWVEFWATRGQYTNSNKKRCVSGYPHAHDRLTDEE